MMKLQHTIALAGVLVASVLNAGETHPLSNASNHLVNSKGEKVAAENVASAPYTLVYYSAHWCPPCRLFTPKLVDFYNKNGGGESFELVFASADRSGKAMYHYMEETEMPWPAVEYDQIDASGVRGFQGRYIPALVMFDSEGEVVASTFDEESGDYYEPATVLDFLDEQLDM